MEFNQIQELNVRFLIIYQKANQKSNAADVDFLSVEQYQRCSNGEFKQLAKGCCVIATRTGILTHGLPVTSQASYQVHIPTRSVTSQKQCYENCRI